MGRVLLSTALIVLGLPGNAGAELQLKPFVGLTFGGTTTFQDTELAAGKVHTLFGVNAALIGEVLGIEADVGRAAGFFQQSPGPPLVTGSSVTTFSGNVMVALPRRMAEYTLRPYFVGGGGMMFIRAD